MVNKKFKKVIIFSGLDCSGKSTQISSLNKHLKSIPVKSLVFWSRGGYTNNIQRLKNFLRIIFRSKLPPPGNSAQRDKMLYKTGYVKKIWINLALFDLILFYSVYLRYKYVMGYTIICDRFLYDTQLDFEIAFPDINLNKLFLWSILKKTAIKWDQYYVSVVPVDVAVERSKHKFEPFPDPPEVLAIRLKRYLEFSDKNPDVVLIDGTSEKDKISAMIEYNLPLKSFR